jgi:hypothetical protein
MSVWQSSLESSPALETSEGALISISVSVEPRLLEDLLEALAQLPFPINPQIYHDAALRYVYADGSEELVPTTLVDFPAYAGWLPEIRRVLESYGFSPDCLQVTGMLDEIHAAARPESSVTEKPYKAVFRLKHARTTAAH